MNGLWNNKTVLITGAGGFIDSHLVETLLAEGAHVSASARYTSRGDPGFFKSFDSGTFRSIGNDFR